MSLPCATCQHPDACGDTCAAEDSLHIQQEIEARHALLARHDALAPIVLTGHVLDVLASLPERSVSCVVTSPPYWSLRKYDAPDVVWGGDEGCEHEWFAVSKQGATVEGYAGKKKWQHSVNGRNEAHPEARHRVDNPDDWTRITRETSTCARCGAWRGQFGLEPTPELYVEHTLLVLRAIRRVLRDDGVVWWNIGDGYSGSWGNYGARNSQQRTVRKERYARDAWESHKGKPPSADPQPDLKPKDLVLMPERVALAAQADGWWMRSRVIWHKPNAMPQSVRDRPTNAHETIWLLTKSARYWWDAEAVREPYNERSLGRYQYQFGLGPAAAVAGSPSVGDGSGHAANPNPLGRNVRDVWTFPTAQTAEAHFATFPMALPLRCIAASCPREVCRTCGKARVRIVERGFTDHDAETASAYEEGSAANRLALLRQAARAAGAEYVASTQTTGWTDCGHDDYDPGIVLDPFAGLATTGLAALRLGRRFIGVELSERYAELARRKLVRWWEDTRLVERDVPEPQMALPLEAP